MVLRREVGHHWACSCLPHVEILIDSSPLISLRNYVEINLLQAFSPVYLLAFRVVFFVILFSSMRQKPYQVQGGFLCWVEEGFRVKELKPETTLTILNEVSFICSLLSSSSLYGKNLEIEAFMLSVDWWWFSLFLSLSHKHTHTNISLLYRGMKELVSRICLIKNNSYRPISLKLFLCQYYNDELNLLDNLLYFILGAFSCLVIREL